MPTDRATETEKAQAWDKVMNSNERERIEAEEDK